MHIRVVIKRDYRYIPLGGLMLIADKLILGFALGFYRDRGLGLCFFIPWRGGLISGFRVLLLNFFSFFPPPVSR